MVRSYIFYALYMQTICNGKIFINLHAQAISKLLSNVPYITQRNFYVNKYTAIYGGKGFFITSSAISFIYETILQLYGRHFTE